MAEGNILGSVAALWRFPVKSMRGEQLGRAELATGGFLGDRAYGLVDVESGKVVSVKNVRQFPAVLSCSARFSEPPEAGAESPPVAITLPDGTAVRSDEPAANALLSRFFGREVVLAESAPPDFTIDHDYPDIEGADPQGRRDTTTSNKAGAAVFAEIGAPSPVPAGAFFDAYPVSLLTTSITRSLEALQPGSRFDPRRFRMNVIIDTAEAGFPENGWVGKRLAVGGSVIIRVTMPDPRCVATTLAQEDLPADLDILRGLVKHNRLDLGPLGAYPCAGAYAVVSAPGPVAVGDPVVFA